MHDRDFIIQQQTVTTPNVIRLDEIQQDQACMKSGQPTRATGPSLCHMGNEIPWQGGRGPGSAWSPGIVFVL